MIGKESDIDNAALWPVSTNYNVDCILIECVRSRIEDYTNAKGEHNTWSVRELKYQVQTSGARPKKTSNGPGGGGG